MERRHLIRLAFGIAVGASAFAATAQAAPMAPPLANVERPAAVQQDIHPAVTSTDEVNRLKPEEVRWGHHHGWHRHGGWHRHWHHRWHRRHW
jgi:hypothetical protein